MTLWRVFLMNADYMAQKMELFSEFSLLFFVGTRVD
jgi:hypothetical protein